MVSCGGETVDGVGETPHGNRVATWPRGPSVDGGGQILAGRQECMFVVVAIGRAEVSELGGLVVEPVELDFAVRALL
jgi:hypothetical protein